MKHVLWVNGWPAIGGAERAQLTLFRELMKRYRVSTVLPEDVKPELKNAIEELEMPYSFAPLTQLRQTLEPAALARFAAVGARSNWLVHRKVTSDAVDLIHVSQVYAIPLCSAACLINRVPLFWLIENPERFNVVNRVVTNACRLDGFAATSKAVLQNAVNGGIRAPIRTMIPNPYDETLFHPGPGMEERARSGGPVRIGFAGVFEDRKGVVELCRAFAELYHRLGPGRVELWLAGRGQPAYRAAIQDCLERSGMLDHTRFFENLRQPREMADYYREIDVFVMLSKQEGMSVAMLEAIGSGLPSAILSPWGDDAIEHERTGIVLQSDGPEAVASALTPLVLDTERRLAMGRAAAEHSLKNFASAVIAERIAELYERIWQARRGERRGHHA
jgi:glycosyltransferase involved in cell wall biosynthesis